LIAAFVARDMAAIGLAMAALAAGGSDSALAQERGVHLRKLFVRLRAQVIRPALDPEIYGARFYRRKDTACFLAIQRDYLAI
jgi:hypothetical protein